MKSCYDVVVIGAGAAGIGAARSLYAAKRDIVVLEASSRIGGRAHTMNTSGQSVDLGCAWLHSANHNSWTSIAEGFGHTINRAPPAWLEQSIGDELAGDDQAEFERELMSLYERIEKAALTGVDGAASDYLDERCRWNPLIRAVSTYYNGVELEGVSIQDFAAYDEGGVDWRVADGLGHVIARAGADVPILTECPASSIDWSGAGVCISTPRGDINAQAAIVATPTPVVAREGLRFAPPLPDKIEAASNLPLGIAEKVFFIMDEPLIVPVDGHLFGSIDSAETGSYHLRPGGGPFIECFFAGEFARRELHFLADHAKRELGRILGADAVRKMRPIAASSWMAEPWIGGSYSYARIGCSAARAALAKPIAERVFFAGEACSPHAYSTAHGAYESGLAAANQALDSLNV